MRARVIHGLHHDLLRLPGEARRLRARSQRGWLRRVRWSPLGGPDRRPPGAALILRRRCRSRPPDPVCGSGIGRL